MTQSSRGALLGDTVAREGFQESPSDTVTKGTQTSQPYKVDFRFPFLAHAQHAHSLSYPVAFASVSDCASSP